MTSAVDPEPMLERRGFVVSVFWIAMALVASSVVTPLVAFFSGPLVLRRSNVRVRIGRLEDLPLDQPQRVEFGLRRRDGWVTESGRRSTWVSRRQGGVTAFDPRCTHLGCAYRWRDAAQQFVCPCHNGLYDLDGRVFGGTPAATARYLPDHGRGWDRLPRTFSSAKICMRESNPSCRGLTSASAFGPSAEHSSRARSQRERAGSIRLGASRSSCSCSSWGRGRSWRRVTRPLQTHAFDSASLHHRGGSVGSFLRGLHVWGAHRDGRRHCAPAARSVRSRPAPTSSRASLRG